MDDLSAQYLNMASGPHSQLHDPTAVVNFVDQMQLIVERSSATRKNFLFDTTTPRGDVIITEASAMKPGNGWITLHVTEGIRRGVHEWGIKVEHQGETTDGSGLMLGIVPKNFSKYDSFISQGGGWCLSRAGKFYGHWRRQETSASIAFGTGDRVIFILDYEAARMTVRVGDKSVVGEINNIAPEVYPAVSLHYRHQFVRFEYRKVYDRHSKKLNWIQRLAFPRAVVYLPLTVQQLEEVPLDSYVFSPMFGDGKSQTNKCKQQQDPCAPVAEDPGNTSQYRYETQIAANARLTVVIRSIQAVRRYCSGNASVSETFLDPSITAELLRRQRHMQAGCGTQRYGGIDAAINCGASLLIHMFLHANMSSTANTLLPVVQSLQDYLRGIDVFGLSEVFPEHSQIGASVSPDIIKLATDNIATLIDRATERGCRATEDRGYPNAGGDGRRIGVFADSGDDLVPALTELLMIIALQSGNVSEILRTVRYLLRSPTCEVSTATLTWVQANKASLTPRCVLPRLNEAYDAIDEDMEQLTPFRPSFDTTILSSAYNGGCVYVHTVDFLSKWSAVGGAYTQTCSTSEPYDLCVMCSSSSIAFSCADSVLLLTNRMAAVGVAVVVYSAELDVRQKVMFSDVPHWPAGAYFQAIASGPGDEVVLVCDIGSPTAVGEPTATSGSDLDTTAFAAVPPPVTPSAVSRERCVQLEARVLSGSKFPELKWSTHLHITPSDNPFDHCVTMRKGSVVDFGSPDACLATVGGHVTVEIWIKILEKSDASVIYQHGDRSTSGEVFIETTRFEGAWRIHGGYRHDSRGVCVVAAPLIPSSESRFLHVALVFDGSWRLFLDGEEVSRTKQGLQVSLENPRQRWTAGNDCTCQLAALRVWKRGRAFREILRDLHRVLSGEEPGLLCQFLFNEHNGNVVHNHVQSGPAAGRHAIIRGPFSRVVCDDHPFLHSLRDRNRIVGREGSRSTGSVVGLPRLEHSHLFFNGFHIGFVERGRVFLGFSEQKHMCQAVFFNAKTGLGVDGRFVLRHRNKMGFVGCDREGRYWELFRTAVQLGAPGWNPQLGQQYSQEQEVFSVGQLPLSIPLASERESFMDSYETSCFPNNAGIGGFAPVTEGTNTIIKRGSDTKQRQGAHNAGRPSMYDDVPPSTFGSTAQWLLNLLSSFAQTGHTTPSNSLFSPLLDDVSIRCVQEIQRLLREHCRVVKTTSSRRSVTLKDSNSQEIVSTVMRILLRLVRRVWDFKLHPDTIGLSEVSDVGGLKDVLRELNVIQRRRSADWREGREALTEVQTGPPLLAGGLKDFSHGATPNAGQGATSLLGVLADIINEAGVNLPGELGITARAIIREGVSLFFPSAIVRASLLREIVSRDQDGATRSPALNVLLYAIVKNFSEITSATALFQLSSGTTAPCTSDDTVSDRMEKGGGTGADERLSAVKITLSTMIAESARQVSAQMPSESRESQLSLITAMSEAIGTLQLFLFSHCGGSVLPELSKKLVNYKVESLHAIQEPAFLHPTVKHYYTELFETTEFVFRALAQRLQSAVMRREGDLSAVSATVNMVHDVLCNSFAGSPLHTAITALPLMSTQEESGWLLVRLNSLRREYHALVQLLKEHPSPRGRLADRWPLHILDTALLLASSWVASFMSLGQLSTEAPPGRGAENSTPLASISVFAVDSTSSAAVSQTMRSKSSALVQDVCDHPLLGAGIEPAGVSKGRAEALFRLLQEQSTSRKLFERLDDPLSVKTPPEVLSTMSLAAVVIVHLSGTDLGRLTSAEQLELVAGVLGRLKGTRNELLNKRSEKGENFPTLLCDIRERCELLLQVKRITESETIQMPSLFLARTFADRVAQQLNDKKLEKGQRSRSMAAHRWKRAMTIIRMKRVYHLALVQGWSYLHISTASALVERIIVSNEATASALRDAMAAREKRAVRRLNGLQHMQSLFEGDARIANKVISLLFSGKVGSHQQFEHGMLGCCDLTRLAVRQVMYNIISHLCEVARSAPQYSCGSKGNSEDHKSPSLSVLDASFPTATLSEVLRRRWLPSDFCFLGQARVPEVVFTAYCSVFEQHNRDSLRHERAEERSHRAAVKCFHTSGSNTTPSGTDAGNKPGASADSNCSGLNGAVESSDESSERVLQYTPRELALFESLNALKSMGLQCAALLGDTTVAPNERRGCVYFLDLLFDVMEQELCSCANYLAQLYLPAQERVLEQVALICTLTSTFARALPDSFMCTDTLCPKGALLAFRLCVVAKVLTAVTPSAAVPSLIDTCIHTSTLLLSHCQPTYVNPHFGAESTMAVVREVIPSADVKCAALAFFFAFALRRLLVDINAGGSSGNKASGTGNGYNFYESTMNCVSALHALICRPPWDLWLCSLHDIFLENLTLSTDESETAQLSDAQMLIWVFVLGGPPSAGLAPGKRVLLSSDEALMATAEAAYIVECNAKTGIATVVPDSLDMLGEERDIPLDNLINASQEEVTTPKADVLFNFLLPALEHYFVAHRRSNPLPLTWSILGGLLHITLTQVKRDPSGSRVLLESGLISHVDNFAFHVAAKNPLPLRYLYELWPTLVQHVLPCQRYISFDAVVPSSTSDSRPSSPTDVACSQRSINELHRLMSYVSPQVSLPTLSGAAARRCPVMVDVDVEGSNADANSVSSNVCGNVNSENTGGTLPPLSRLPQAQSSLCLTSSTLCFCATKGASGGSLTLRSTDNKSCIPPWTDGITLEASVLLYDRLFPELGEYFVVPSSWQRPDIFFSLFAVYHNTGGDSNPVLRVVLTENSVDCIVDTDIISTVVVSAKLLRENWDRWIHMAVVVDSKAITLYKDGVGTTACLSKQLGAALEKIFRDCSVSKIVLGSTGTDCYNGSSQEYDRVRNASDVGVRGSVRSAQGSAEAALETVDGVIVAIDSVRVWGCARKVKPQRTTSDFVAREQTLPAHNAGDGSHITFRFSEATGSETMSEKKECYGVLSGNVRWAPFPIFSDMVNLDKTPRTDPTVPSDLSMFIPRREFETFFSTIDRPHFTHLVGEYLQTLCAHLSRRCVVAAICQATSPEYRVLCLQSNHVRGRGDITAISTPTVEPRHVIGSTDIVERLINLLRYSDTGSIDRSVLKAFSQFVEWYFNMITSESQLIKRFHETAFAIIGALHDEVEPFQVVLPPASCASTEAQLIPIATVNGPGCTISFDANSRGIEHMAFMRDRKQRALLAKCPDSQGGWPELEIPSDSVWFYAKPALASRCAAPTFTVSARSLRPYVACAIFGALRRVLTSASRFHCGLPCFLNTPFISLLTVRAGTAKGAGIPACRLFTAVLELWRKFPKLSPHDQSPLKIMLAHLNAPLMMILQRGQLGAASQPLLSSSLGRYNLRVQTAFELLIAAIRLETAWKAINHSRCTQQRWKRLYSLWEQSIGHGAPTTTGPDCTPPPGPSKTPSGPTTSVPDNNEFDNTSREFFSATERGFVRLVPLPFSSSTAQHQPKSTIFQRSNGIWCASCDRGYLSARSNVGFKRGRFYFEVRIPANGEAISVGVVTERAQQHPLLASRGLGHDGNSWGFESAQMCRFYHGFRHEFTVRTKWKALDVIGIVLDLEAETLACMHDDRQVGIFDNLKAPRGISGSTSFFPAVSFGPGGVDVNFGAAPFVCNLPAGFFPVDPSNYVVSPTSKLWVLMAAVDVGDALAEGSGCAQNGDGGLDSSSCVTRETLQLPGFFQEADDAALNYYAGRSGPLNVSLLPCDAKTKMSILHGSEVRVDEDPRFVRGSVCVRSGRWYYEVALRGDAMVSVGWATSTAATDWSRSKALGSDADSWVVEGNRAVARHNKHQRSVGGQLWKHGDIIGCMVDCDKGVIAYTVNGMPLREVHDTSGHGVIFQSVNCSCGLMPVVGVEPKNAAAVYFREDELSFHPPRCKALGTTGPILSALEHYYCGTQVQCRGKGVSEGSCCTGVSFTPSLARQFLLSFSALTELNFLRLSSYCYEDILSKTTNTMLYDKLQGRENAVRLLVTLQNLTSLTEYLVPYAQTTLSRDEHDTLLAGPVSRSLYQCRQYILPTVALRSLHCFFSHTNCTGENLKLTLNRRKALSLMKDVNAPLSDRVRGSLFGQIYQLLHDKNVSLFCTSKKLWSVSFVGEGADDIGGPYRESISQLCSELMGPSLPLFIPSANQITDIGDSREAFVVNPELQPPVRLGMYHFFGRLIGGCLRSAEPLPVYLPSILWKALLGAPVDAGDLARIDKSTLQSYRCIYQLARSNDDEAAPATDEDIAELCPGGFTAVDDAGRERELFPGGKAIAVNARNVHLFLELALHYRLHSMGAAQIKAIADGFHQVVPLTAVSLLKWYELERLVCGLSDYDSDELLNAARYEGLKPDDNVVQYLRQVLRQFSRHERALFMRFVSGRERFPSGVRLKLMLDVNTRQMSDGSVDNGGAEGSDDGNGISSCDAFDDKRLPHASTCFYWLSLPHYSSAEVLRERLLFAIQHCLDIDADFVVHDSGNPEEDEMEPTLAVNVEEDEDEFEDVSRLR
ncbi:putative ubiquitin-transferase [Trypanosoma vivax]|nr:putative ubiquitin-transferase [Trypanosoma vivax]